MGTIKRLNDAQQRLQDAENAMPGAYEPVCAGHCRHAGQDGHGQRRGI